MNKFRLLKADEIECRIAQVKSTYITLILYKTARTDANLLDETVGVDMWENDFKVVDGVLYGGIGIHKAKTDNDGKIQCEVIWKWDAGIESNTEAEKGRASDAFKRAGFKWGIGRELYTAPFIKIPSSNCKITKDEKGNYKCYEKFEVSEVKYNENSEIIHLVIINSDSRVEVFRMGKKVTEDFSIEQNQKITNKEATTLKTLLEKKNVNIPKLLEQCKVENLEDLSGEQYANILGKLNG